MKPALFLTLVLVILLSACSPKPASPPPAVPTGTALPTASPTPVPPFAYDPAVPFDVKINSQTEQDGVTVVDLSYAAHAATFSPSTAGRTMAYLVKPQGEGPFAGIIYMHWQLGGRNQFLDEAKAFARHGVICLLLQGYFPYSSAPTGAESDREKITGQIIELRRAIDFLLTQPGIDPDRLGYVGHDYGAIYGGDLAGIDHRIHSYVLSAGAPSFSTWIGFSGVKPEQYLELVGDLDPIHLVADAAPANLFFQFGERDGIISHDLGTSFYDAASEPKQVTWYDDLHGMTSQAVTDGRQSWLIDQLQLEP